MNRLFETYVGHIEARDVRPGFEVSTQEASRSLATCGGAAAFTLKPDISVWRSIPGGAGEVVRILDAKWKRVDPRSANWGVNEADVYQLLAYAVRFQCARLELAYPQPDDVPAGAIPPTFTIESPSLTLPLELVVKTVRLGEFQRPAPVHPDLSAN